MSDNLKPFPNIHRFLFDLFEDKLEIAPAKMGNKYPTGVTEFVRVAKLGGQREKLRDYPLVDVEVVAGTYDEASELIESIDSLLLGYPQSVTTPSGVVVLDSAFVTRSPTEIPWDGPGRRLAATYSLTLRRRD